jgi:hypothetical protein
MRKSMIDVSRFLLFTTVLCASVATATVALEGRVSGKVTGLTNQSIQIDGVTYEIAPTEATRAELANVRVGDSVTIAIAGRLVSPEIKVRVVEHVAHNNRD